MFNQCIQCHKTLKGLEVLKNDTPAVSAWDIPLALVLLTRLPIPHLPERIFARQAAAAWAFPLAGLIVSGLAYGLGLVLMSMNHPASVAAVGALVALIVTTGAMHEDGLADTADGLWGGFTRERRLEIMKDSHIGTYGVLALILSQLLRWSLFAALFSAGTGLTLIAAAMWSRALMPGMMASLPNARGSGLSHGVGAPSLLTCGLGLGLALVGSVILIGSAAVIPALIAVLAAVGLAGLAKRKIGGQTGDILGATQQIGELTFLATALALL